MRSLSCITILALNVQLGADAFSSLLRPRVSSHRDTFVCLDLSVQHESDHTRKQKVAAWAPYVAAAFFGWSFSTQIAAAAQPPLSHFIVAVTQTDQAKNPLASMFEQKPEPIYQKLDFSLPSYEASVSSTGFGEGTEARNLGSASTGADKSETDKQREAMRKAEAARQERIQQAKELAKMREAEDQLRAQAKKEEAARRIRGIFD